jgi:hypothetical protein
VRIIKVVGFFALNQQNWFGIFLNFLQISMNFLVLWIDLQENLDRFQSNQVLTFTQNTLNRLKSMQSGPWPGRAAWYRPTPASRRRSRPGKLPGSTRGSPRSGGWPALGRRDGRRGGSTAGGGGGCSGSGKRSEEALCWAVSKLGRSTGA